MPRARYGTIPFSGLTKKEQARRITSGEAHGRMTPAQAAKARRFWGLPKPPKVTKAATVYGGEKLARPWENVPPPPPKPQRYDPGATKPGKPLPPPDRYALALQAPVNAGARRQLLKTASPQRRKQLRDDLRPGPPPSPPGMPWWRRNSPVERAISLAEIAGVTAAAVGRPIGETFLGTFSGTPQRSSLTGLGQSRPQAAGIPPEAGPIVGHGLAKVLTGGAGAVDAYFRNPREAWVETGREAIEMGRGIGQAFALPVVLSDPAMPLQEKKSLIREIAVASIEDLNKRYGPDTTYTEAFKLGGKEPLISFINAAGVISPGAKALTALNALRAGATFGEALDLISVPARARTLRLRVSGGAETTHVEAPWSPSPLTRTVVQRPYDVVSRFVDTTPGLRRLPIAERKRAAGRLRRDMTRQMRRLPAEARALWIDVAEVANKSFHRSDDPMRLALALVLQKPKGFTNEEWLQSVATDLRQMIESGKFVTPGERVSPGVQRLLNRARNYERKTQDARTRRRSKAASNIAREQVRLSDALEDLNGRREDLRDEAIDLEESGSDPERLKEIDTELRVLNQHAAVAREELDDLTVDQEPIDSPERTHLVESLLEHRNFDEQTVADVIAVPDTRARVWARQTGEDPADWYRNLETRVVKEGEIPKAGVLYQTASGRRPTPVPRVIYTEAKVASRKKSKAKPRKGTATGVPTTKTLWAETDEGVPFKLAGDITPPDWVQRVLAVIPTAKARDALARWYEHYEPMFTKAFGDDADRVMRGFAVSQANASPSSGLTAVLKVMDIIDRGESVGPREISVVGQAIEKAVKDEEIDKFVAAKLSDFIDSLAGRETRTWMGDDPDAGAPVAVDVHAIRDRGFIDSKLVKRLTGRGYKQGKDFKVEGRGAATGPLYERIAEWYHEIADHLNEMDGGKGFDGRNDWTPAQAQALGWSSIQIAHKVIPEGFAEAFANNTRRITFEVTQGPLGLGNDLTSAQTRRVARAMGRSVEELVEDTPGLWLRDVKVGIGGWAKGDNINISVDVIGTKEAVQASLTRFAKAFDQEWVQATREVTGKNSRAALLIDSPKFRDPRTRARFFRALARIEPRLEGFMDYDVDGVPGMVIRTNSPSVSPKNADKFVNRYRAAIEQAEAETGIGVSGSVRNIEMLTGGQHGEVAPIQTLAGSGGGLRHGALDDPFAARIRDELTAAIERERGGAGGAAPEQRGVTRHQVREGDLQGAIELLDGPEGKRILYLTENANPSTVLHELVGHATDEMKRYYPDEFRKVEEEIGMPYADWTTAEHETFARWAERYFLEGHAPTPELAPVMDRIKSWMRAIYAGMIRSLGGRMPVATRVLFDSYFGAYDDVNVARIAMNMNGKWDERLNIERPGGAEVITRTELQALKKRIETQRYGRSLDGMIARLEELQKKGTAKRPLGRREGPLDEGTLDEWEAEQIERTLTPEEQQEVNQLSAQVLVRQAQDEIRKSTREKNLRTKLSDLEKALERGTDNRRFQGALESMRWISEDRERILREAFGNQYDEVFSNRTDLLADWLVSRGLLKPEFDRGTAHYFPATMETGMVRSLKQPARAIQGQVVGKTRMDLLTLHKRNNMILWQRGDWTADPSVLLEAHARAQGYAWMNEVKQQLYKIGRPLTLQEAQNLPKNVYIINPHGTPIGPGLKAQMRSNSTTSDVQNFYSGLDGGDNVTLEQSMKTYADAFMIDPANLPEGFNPFEIEGLRVVPRDVVEKILRPVQGGGTAAGRRWDDATTLARWALIYSNVPGYMIANGMGNFGFLFAQTGIKLPQAIMAARKVVLNPKLRILAEAEAGEVPYQAAISRARDFSQAADTLERRALHHIGIVDRFPRVVSWVYEAQKRGYKTEDDLFRLIKGADEKTRRDRAHVAEMTNQHMVDFDRLSDFERQYLTRILFVWPWIRGATAWPFWYAKNYQERTAFAANVGMTLEDRRKEMLGNTASWYEGLFPVSAEGNRAQVIQTNPISPTSTAMQQLELLRDTMESVYGIKKQDSQHLLNIFSPVLRDAVEIGTGRNDFGQEQSLRDILLGLPTTMVPGYRIVQALRDPETVPNIYTETGLKQRASRTFLRVAPLEISIPRLNAQAAVAGEKSATEKINVAVAQAGKAWAKLRPGEPTDMKVVRAARMKVLYSEYQKQARDKKKNRQWDPKKLPSGLYEREPTLTEFEKAQIAYNILTHTYPQDTTLRRHSPADELNKKGYSPDSAHGKERLKLWFSAVWGTYTDLDSFVKQQEEDEKTHKQWKEEREANAS